MIEYIVDWYKAKFADPHVVTLSLFIIVTIAVLYFFNDLLMPVLVAVVLAFLLERPVQQVMKIGLNRNKATTLVMIAFTGIGLLIFLGLLPVLWNQTSNLIQEVPAMVNKANVFIMELPEKYPDLIQPEQIENVIRTIKEKILELGQFILETSLNSISDIVALMIYLILVPIMVFFFLKDKTEILSNLGRFLPKERRLTKQVGNEMHHQIHNYIRGKVVEILIIGGASTIAFALLGLNYAVLLGALVGLSVLVPYVGATVVTFPVLLVALFQWGVSPEFGYVMLAYAIIQILDGNVLVPILFSEAVNLHPVAIIIAVIIFGGLWGFWGVFFAIPLATLVKAVINAWPESGFSSEEPSVSE
ncbi:AI-2E family transporter [Thalassotalea aquiviva]|uniref:AI-2E family transporter n=1 Tax=Thalassotalea aquiviva TaxID=3242415 RepID=UPI00352AB1E6